VRALLDLLRENRAAVQDQVALFELVLHQAARDLEILGSEVGDKALSNPR